MLAEVTPDDASCWMTEAGSSTAVPVTLNAIATAVAWRLDTLARRRANKLLCTKCTYDRTGLAAGAVCPECGAVPSSV